MRDFLNWNLLERIENSPREYIVQRNVKLLNSFEMGYTFLCLQLKNREKLERTYEHIPCFDEYFREKYKAGRIGTRKSLCTLPFVCEDERDIYETYFEWMHEYEKTFPVSESIVYIPLPEQRDSLKRLMTEMKRRLPMYLGEYSLAGMRAFLDGHFLCKKEHDLPVDDFEIRVKEFTQQIICEYLSLDSPFVTWDRKYGFDRREYICRNEKELMDLFWSDLEKFTKVDLT